LQNRAFSLDGDSNHRRIFSFKKRATPEKLRQSQRRSRRRLRDPPSAPDLRCRGVMVILRIGLVLKLQRDKRAGNRRSAVARALNRAAHASSTGVRTTSAPKPRIRMHFSSAKPRAQTTSLCTAIYANQRQAHASVARRSLDNRRAGMQQPTRLRSRIMPSAARSLMLPPGLRNSSLAKTAVAGCGATRVSSSIGVEPTSCVISAAIRSADELKRAVSMWGPVYNAGAATRLRSV